MKARPPVPAEPERMPRLFVLQRVEDVHGLSGTGRVAWGCQFPGGKVVMEWQTRGNQVSVWDHISDAIHHHGHGGKTKLVWLDAQPLVEQLDTAAARACYQAFAAVEANTQDFRYLQAALRCLPYLPILLDAYDALAAAYARQAAHIEALTAENAAMQEHLEAMATDGVQIIEIKEKSPSVT